MKSALLAVGLTGLSLGAAPKLFPLSPALNTPSSSPAVPVPALEEEDCLERGRPFSSVLTSWLNLAKSLVF